jgi:hypothetical protein
MSEGEVEDWLSVAVGEVLNYPAHVLQAAASQARRTCTHHSQIVPAIIKAAEAAAPRHDPLVSAMRDVPAFASAAALPAPDRRITQEMVDAMSPELIRMGLTCEALVRDADGNVIVNPE